MRMTLVVAMLVLGQFSQAELVKKTVDYKEGSTALEGYLVYDEAQTGKRPGILVTHNWLGLTDETKEKSDEFAKLGYVVFASDIYGKGVRPKGEEAGKTAGIYKTDRVLYRKRLNAALNELSKLPNVDKKSLVAAGYCFGGTGSIELARSGAPLKGVISIHGGLDSPNPELGKKIKARVLALHGGDDPFVSESDLKGFENEMRTAKVDWQLIKYGNTVHSFTDKAAGSDNSKGQAYNANSDKRSWEAIKQFLAETVK